VGGELGGGGGGGGVRGERSEVYLDQGSLQKKFIFAKNEISDDHSLIKFCAQLFWLYEVRIVLALITEKEVMSENT
jgi:hypothetical protein